MMFNDDKQFGMQRRSGRMLGMLLTAGLFAAGGLTMTQFGSAATYVSPVEAEAGSLVGGAARIDDASASGGAAVRFLAAPVPPPSPTPGNYSLRFFGTQTNDIDRVKIPLTPNKSANVGADFTLEWWMKTAAGNDRRQNCIAGVGVGWIEGNIIWDRDVDGPGDLGDYGISVFADGRLAFGTENGTGSLTICSAVSVADGQWHHVAATRSNAGQLCLYVDGMQRGCGDGPAGNISYREGRSTSQPGSDPFLVIGAEKHDYWTADEGYHGWLDEARLSNIVRYSTNFSRPTAAFDADAGTVALYHFNTGSGTVATDVTGTNNGSIKSGGVNGGPNWTADVPF